MRAAALALLIAVAPALAQPDPAADAAKGPKALYEEGRSLSARRVAAEALARDPEDVEAHLITALVTWQEDGRHAQALARLRLADRLYQQRGAQLGAEGWRIEWQILRNLAFLASEMSEHELFLATADRFNDKYLPKIEAERAWTLMTMGRLAEARAAAEGGTRSADPWQQTVGWNTLCALDSYYADRSRMIETCERSLEVSLAIRDDDPITTVRNAGVAVRAALRFDRAEELMLRATRNPAGGWTNPWIDLVLLYIDQGRGADAAQAAVQANRWRMAQKGSDRAQTRAKDDAVIATLLLAAGEADRARRLVDRALDQPDRSQSSTASEANTRGGHALMRLVIRDVQAEIAAERAAEGGWSAALAHRAARWLPDLGALADRALVRAALLDGKTLRATVGEVDEGRLVGASTWMLPEIIGIAGIGVVGAAVERARERAVLPGIEAYFDAWQAELRARAGSRDHAATLRAAEALPKPEALLKARLHAVAAEQARRAGDRAAHLAALERAMQLDPGTVRRHRLALPVAISHDGSPAAARAGAIAAWSPRFTEAPDGFKLFFSATSACLATPTGGWLGCYEPPTPEPSSDGEPGEPATVAQAGGALLAAVHRGAFAMPLGLSTFEQRGLDGATTVDRRRDRERMESLLRGL